jgi:hypothetical protein
VRLWDRTHKEDRVEDREVVKTAGRDPGDRVDENPKASKAGQTTGEAGMVKAMKSHWMGKRRGSGLLSSG